MNVHAVFVLAKIRLLRDPRLPQTCRPKPSGLGELGFTSADLLDTTEPSYIQWLSQALENNSITTIFLDIIENKNGDIGLKS